MHAVVLIASCASAFAVDGSKSVHFVIAVPVGTEMGIGVIKDTFTYKRPLQKS